MDGRNHSNFPIQIGLGKKSSKESDSKKDPDYQPLASDDDDEEVLLAVKRKRSRIMQISSDSDDSDRENENDNSQMEAKTPKSKSDKLARKSSLDSPLSKKKPKRAEDNKISFEDKLAASIADTDGKKLNIKMKEKKPELDVVDTVWLHNKLEFLQPANIRDAKKNRPGHPQYDPKTLYVPDKYLNSLTPVCTEEDYVLSFSFRFNTIFTFDISFCTSGNASMVGSEIRKLRFSVILQGRQVL